MFLKNAKRKGFVKYLEGGENFTSLKEELEDIKFRRSRGEDVDAISAATAEDNGEIPKISKKKTAEERAFERLNAPPDPKVDKRLEKLKGTFHESKVDFANRIRLQRIEARIHSESLETFPRAVTAVLRVCTRC